VSRTKKEREFQGAGPRLRDWRKAKGWTQTEAAVEFRTKQRTWADWELEEGVPDLDVAEKLEVVTDGRVRMSDWADVARALRAKKDESGPLPADVIEKAS
jgi:transcriptional regulator with XRE-family HTH domain